MYKKHPLMLIASILLITGCANKFFPDKKLYQYPEKTNGMAVVYPDGTIHHSDGSITKSRKPTDSRDVPELQAEDGSEKKVDDNSIINQTRAVNHGVDISAKKDSTGRHARHRGEE